MAQTTVEHDVAAEPSMIAMQSSGASRVQGVVAAIEHSLLWPVIVVACALLVAVTLMLLGGAVSRFVFNRPITWIDELVSMLFLWLAMLGAVIAFCRAEHMRMSALVSTRSVQTQRFATAAYASISIILFAVLLPQAIEYAIDEAIVTTPNMNVSGAWKAAAMPAGIGLMLVFGLLQLVRLPNRRDVMITLVIGIGVAVLLQLSGPAPAPLGYYRLLIFFVGLLGVCIAAGVPIAFSFAIATFSFLACTTNIPLTVVINRIDEGMSHVILLAVPLFVLLGCLVEITGMAKAMVDFLVSLVGHFRGGLHYVLMVAMYLVSGISGSKAADMAAIAPPLFPEMRARGADPGELVALLAATSAQTETVPPSIVLITVGSVTGVSIASLFTGGILPSLIMGCFLAAVVWWRTGKRSRTSDVAPMQAFGWPERLRTLVIAVPALVLPFIIRTAVVEGFATPTEVSTLGILYCALYAVLFAVVMGKRPDMRALARSLLSTASLTGAILLIVGCASAMAWALTQSGLAQQLTVIMHSVPGGAYGFLAISIIVFVVLGSVLEGLPAVVLLAPIVYPIARSFGVHEVHYSIVVILGMGIGLFAPPFGLGYYTACAIANVETSAGLKPIVGYLVALVLGLFVIAAVPWLSIGFLQ
jgi:tripartite ATP-independent transporter DctM subunit